MTRLLASQPARIAFGYVSGLTMAFGAAISFATARAGVLAGLTTDEIILARTIVAGLTMLPILLWWGLPSLAGIGWRRGLVLLLTGGPLFAFLQTGGYAFAPLAHGAVIAPSTVAVLSTIGALLFLGERLTSSHIASGALVLLGVVLVSFRGLTGPHLTEKTWIGDLMFITSSVLWATFTILMRKWRVDPVRATAVVAVLAIPVVIPAYLALHGSDRLSELPIAALAAQGVVLGLVQGVITLIAYTKSIDILGVSRAVLFSAIVPAISILIGIPMLGEVPDAIQIAGLGIASFGLLVAVALGEKQTSVKLSTASKLNVFDTETVHEHQHTERRDAQGASTKKNYRHHRQ